MQAQFLFDSAFANGAYSHSFGLESYISWGEINDAQSYQKWLNIYMLNSFAKADGAVYAIASKLKNKKLSLLKLARVANASISSLEARNGAINMARATLKNTNFMHSELAKYYSKICENEKFAHPSVAFSVLAPNLSAELAYSSIKTLTQNATRAIPLSYKKSCEILYENIQLAKISAQISEKIADEVLKKGYFSLININSLKNEFKNQAFSSHQELDFSMFAHESLTFRLFMS